ncbi:hypothetical protein LEP1GSC034_0994 [Leptospira interrogans str. 2003000735]|uniref:Uncharacterized protein n=2 Tax=Leptospira interrogans TaxID=173 RepID=A0A829D748_LEPIR|nr:hypothetical protein [Leptospira interrogans]EMY06267.1 hypothetical protein LEP1GSC029_3131 [Leptospira interrogans str. 2002000626]EMY25573.1 hypothetical protein LEP1GSC115_1501 [Leptospira interrogans serovar Australis str. 200703203]EKN89883.1 hypothetical protein LEP1GSC027_3945 [Leptospira interrogans str. 2002000624]EKQ40231.1 hypothetical protein LEP1GSC025_2140 [Leptospira interrogans str. 2002000621]EKQ46147.1 hypothetical protein LEP1GSC026_3139 [Leptospira interrogans str. 2002
MIDFSNDPVSFGDLVLDYSNDDLQTDSNSVRIVLSEIREMFEMTVADDLDYPEIYSRQRAAQNSTEFIDQAARVRDAERILNLHPMIDTNSIDVGLNSENGIVVSFHLKTGEAVQSFVMR